MTIYFDAALALAALGCTAYIVYGPIQLTLTDMLRQSLFAQRDKLVAIVESGRLSANSEAYKTSRNLINSYIRNAHLATMPRFLLNVILLHERIKSSKPAYSLSDIRDAETKAEVEKILKKCVHLICKTMVSRSPVILALLAVFIPIFIIKSLVKGGTMAIKDSLAPIEARVGSGISSTEYVHSMC